MISAILSLMLRQPVKKDWSHGVTE